MTFVDFCRLHGVIISHTPKIGNWARYPTEDHPHKRNGAVKFMLTHGFVQNHATEDTVSVWQPDVAPTIRAGDVIAIKNASSDIAKKQGQAAIKAAVLLKQARLTTHPYLRRKGFPDDEGSVIETDEGLVLLIPMRVAGALVGLQQVSPTGEKRFLYGQKSNGAEFVFDNRGVNILCEGYATALSLRLALKTMKRRYTLHVCFSASNLVNIASQLEEGFVIADNDLSGVGEASAKKTGWPYWMSDSVGQDFNDFHLARGLFAATQGLTKLLSPTVAP